MNGNRMLMRLASLTFFMQSLDTTMLYLALPTMASELSQPVLSMEWVIILYMLAVIAVTPVSGWLTAHWGTRRVYVAAVSLFALGSLGCAFAYSLAWLNLFRVIQGCGGALMLPVVKVLVLQVSSPSRQLSRLNTMTLLGLLGTVAGPLISGVIITWLSWRVIFIINLPLALICLYLNLKHMPARFESLGKFDLRGFLLIVLALSLIILGLTGINNQQMPYSLAFICIIGSAFLLWRYKQKYLNSAQSLFSPALFKLRTFSVSISGNIAVRICLASMPLFISLMLQQEFHYSPVQVSLIMLSIAAGSIAARLFLCQILRILGYRTLLLTSIAIAALLIYQFVRINASSTLVDIIGLMFLFGMINSILYATLNTLAFSDLTDKTYSAGNTILIVTQLVSITFSVTVGFAIVKLLSALTDFTNLACYHGLFIVLSVGLLLSGFIIASLKPGDGNQLLQQS